MSVERHGVDLPESARPAWRAYCAMLASKDAHFAFLGSLDEKYREGGRRSLAEIARLEQLLDEHDRCVRAFTEAMRALKAADEVAHGLLVRAIGELNQSLGAEGGGAAN